MNFSYHCFHDVFYIATYIVQPLWSHSRAKGTVYYMYILDVYKTWSTSLKLIRIGHFFISKSLSGTIKQACFLERVGRASLVVLQVFFSSCVLNCSGCGAFFDRKIPQRVCVPGRSDVWTKCVGGWKAGVHKNNGRSRKGRVVVPCSRIREGTCVE